MICKLNYSKHKNVEGEEDETIKHKIRGRKNTNDLRGSANPAYVHGLPSLRSPKPTRSSTITSSFRVRKPFYTCSFRRSGGQERNHHNLELTSSQSLNSSRTQTLSSWNPIHVIYNYNSLLGLPHLDDLHIDVLEPV